MIGDEGRTGETTVVDINAEDPRLGGTFLTWSAEFHRSDLVAALLERGADPLKTSRNEGLNALEWATMMPESTTYKKGR